jgi:ferric-dicitrate binding protein FerR (iron transport regulator)
MHDMRLQELFDLYLQRRCGPEEVVELVALLERADAAEVLTEPMRRLWEEVKANQLAYPVDWERMYARVSQVEDDLVLLNRPGRRFGWRVAVAASVAVVVAGTILWGMNGRHVRKAAVGVPVQAVVVDAGGATQAMVTNDRKRVVHLPDGSTVCLNKNSRLEYPRVFRDTMREVVLSGEAYFDITPLAGRPFIVHTGKLSTRVLGTAFNIRAYPGDKAIAITVTSGKVQVSNERAAVGLLTADQQMRYDVASATIVQEKVDVRPLVAWRPSEVSFDDITMEEAARRVGEWLGVQVHFVNPALKDCRVTASFYREDQLEEILTVLCAVNQMSYAIHDKDVSIDGRGCN